jgi:uncharacterized protein (TIGR02246 family)
MTEGGFRHTPGMDAAPESDLVIATLDTFDRAFAAGDLDAVVELFTEDASLLLLYGPPAHGRAEIRALWAPTFAKWDMSAWATERLIVDVHADRAYTVSTYTETLVDRAGTDQSRVVVGRVVMFLRRLDDGSWQISFVMNSHARPVELLG